MAAAKIHMPHVMSGLTLNVRVTGMQSMKVRLWLGAQLLKLAAFVMGTGIEVNLDS